MARGTFISYSEIKTQNWLLSSLPEAEREHLKPHLKPILLARQQIIFDSDDAPEYAYFLDSGVVSLLLCSRDGHEVEVATVGREGLIGDAALLGCSKTLTRGVVQVAGSGWRISAHLVHSEFRRPGVLQDRILSYLQTILANSFQIELCNRRHSVEQRLARWLLLLRYRSGRDTWPLTQENIAQALGTRRPGITDACAALRQTGLIEYGHGQFRICDTSGLKAFSCECYGAIARNLNEFAARIQRSASI